jgi:outer membrane beta-barrel protein
MRTLALAIVLLSLSTGAQARVNVEKVYVVQPKVVGLANHFETVLLASAGLNTRYVGEAGALISLIYHIRESLALELQGGWLFGRYNSSTFSQLSSLKDASGNVIIDNDGTAYGYKMSPVDYYRVPWLATLNFQWTPFYGKLAFHNLAFGDFGIYFLVGAGVSGLELINPASASADVITKGAIPIQMTTSYGAGIRVHFSSRWGLRLEVRDNVLALWTRDESSFDIAHKVNVQLGVSYVF